jgi:hypothetical protein
MLAVHSAIDENPMQLQSHIIMDPPKALHPLNDMAYFP